jgi:deferrochelatase/peroxidase EfeB
MTTRPRTIGPVGSSDIDHLVNLAATKIEALEVALAASEARLAEVEQQRNELFRFVDGITNYQHVSDNAALRAVGESAHRLLTEMARPAARSAGEGAE